MSEQDEPRRISREEWLGLRAGNQTTVRYGRATLTIRPAAAVLGTPLGDALAEYREGGCSAEEVAWRFLRSQEISHSATFDWDAVELEKLLPRVAAAMRDPKLKAERPEQLVDELIAFEEREAEAVKRLAKQIRSITVPAEHLRKLQIPTEQLRRVQRIQQQAQGYTEVGQQMQRSVRALQRMAGSRIMDPFTSSQRKQIAQLQDALLPARQLFTLGIDQEAMRRMLGMQTPASIRNPFTEADWRPILQRVAGAAREAQAPDVAAAVEATAEEAEKGASEADFEAMQKALERLTEEIEESNRIAREQAEVEKSRDRKEDAGKGRASIAQSAATQLAFWAIKWLLEWYLLTEFGIELPPTPMDDD